VRASPDHQLTKVLHQFLVVESLAADQTARQDGRIEQDENRNTGTASHAHADMVRSEAILSILSRCSIVLAELRANLCLATVEPSSAPRTTCRTVAAGRDRTDDSEMESAD